jgi:hypothetical protein
MDNIPHYTYFEEEYEWQVFKRIQPLFKSDLKWEPCPKASDPERSLTNDAVDAVKFDTLIVSFEAEMLILPSLLPEKPLLRPEFLSCRDKLRTLLGLLESLVDKTVVKAAVDEEAPTGMLWRWGTSDYYGGIPQMQNWAWVVGTANLVKTATKTMFNKLTGWHASPTSRSAAASIGISSMANTRMTATWPDDNAPPVYHNLKALGRLVEQHRDTAPYVALKHPVDFFKEAVKYAKRVRRAFKKTAIPERTFGTREVPETNWEEFEPLNVSCRLFYLLQIGTSGCKLHEAKLQLDGTRLDSPSEPLRLDVFVSSCPGSSSARPDWRQSHFTMVRR